MKKILIIILMFTVISCEDKKPNVRQACAPLPIEDGYVLVKTRETNTTLKIPMPAYLTRQHAINSDEKGCDYIRSLSLDYSWYEKRLYSPLETVQKGVYENKNRVPVRVYLRGNYFLSEKRNNSQPLEKWKLEPALPHKKFPLEWYPRYYWDDPDNPSEKSLKRASLDSRWGIRDTKYKGALYSLPFITFCSIPPIDGEQPDTRLDNDFAHYGDSKCRGWIDANKGDVAIGFMIDIWAFKGDYKNHHPIKDINLIYDALVEEFQSYIQE